MVTGITGRIWNNGIDIASFAGVGYLSGHVVNQFTKWSSASSLIMKTGQVDVTHAAACCGLFAAIDRLAYNILNSMVGKDQASKPFYSAFRIATSTAATSYLLNVGASLLKSGS